MSGTDPTTAPAPAPATGSFARPDHDHHACVSEALVGAAALCRERGVRLTGARQRPK